MGAEYSDMNIGYGVTPADAFNSVVEDAEWQHGHGGYTGTMAEKGSFKLVGQLPPRMMTEKFSTLAHHYREFIGYDWGGKGTWVEHKTVDCKEHRPEFEAWLATKPTGEYDGNFGAYYSAKPKPECKYQCGMWDGRYVKLIKHRTTPIPKHLRNDWRFMDMITSFIEVADDKWGPAAAVEANKGERAQYLKGMRGLKRGTRVFLFEGYCSS